tara:strand:+ start:91 stop:537 length:447 start_codon:yes stop_codon:yes gene_type:complete
MIAVIQRVDKCSVDINEDQYSNIDKGVLVLVGVGSGDTDADICYIGDKVLHLRVFPDSNNKMNKSLRDINGEIMLVSQFTLYADCKKGNRPSFIKAEKAKKAQEIYLRLLDYLQSKYDKVSSGSFQSFMKINLINNGPVTIIINSNDK